MDYQLRACLNQKKAIDHYTQAIKDLLEGNYKSALNQFSLAIAFNPNFVEAYYKRGNVKRSLKDFRGSYLDFLKAIELQPRLKNIIEPECFKEFVERNHLSNSSQS